MFQFQFVAVFGLYAVSDTVYVIITVLCCGPFHVFLVPLFHSFLFSLYTVRPTLIHKVCEPFSCIEVLVLPSYFAKSYYVCLQLGCYWNFFFFSSLDNSRFWLLSAKLPVNLLLFHKTSMKNAATSVVSAPWSKNPCCVSDTNPNIKNTFTMKSTVKQSMIPVVSNQNQTYYIQLRFSRLLCY